MNLNKNLANKKLVIALSGGVDSVVLLHFLLSQFTSSNIRAIHINHNLSPNALEWQNFCLKLCKQYKVKIDVFNIQINKLNNLEHQARELRYKALFNNLKNDEILLTAHHKNDQAETVLLNLFRGSSSVGLSAMPEIKNNHYRIILDKDKDWILNYAKRHNLEFIVDESNLDNNFRRNFIRNEVLVLIKTKYPQIITTLNQVAKKQQNNLQLIDELAEIDIKKYNLVVDNLLVLEQLKTLAKHRVLNIIYFHLRAIGFKLPSTKVAQQIYQALFSKDDAKVLIRWAEHECRKFNGFLYFLPVKKPLASCKFNDELKNKPGFNIRYRAGGEKIKLTNKSHSQKLKKVMQEIKIPPWLRDNLRMYYLNDELVAIEKIGYCQLK